jgi:DNA-binding NarL/FixJ family response regulator
MRPIDSFDFSTLTDRERDVLSLLARGMTNKEIAACLGLATGTVRNTIAAIQNRLGVADRTQAALVAYHAGLANTSPCGMCEAKPA